MLALIECDPLKCNAARLNNKVQKQTLSGKTAWLCNMTKMYGRFMRKIWVSLCKHSVIYTRFDLTAFDWVVFLRDLICLNGDFSRNWYVKSPGTRTVPTPTLMEIWADKCGCGLTRKPEVLSSRQRKRTVKLRSSRWQFSGRRTSWSTKLADSGGRNEFHINCRCSSSRSSECTSSYTDWCTMSDCESHKQTFFADGECDRILSAPVSLQRLFNLYLLVSVFYDEPN